MGIDNLLPQTSSFFGRLVCQARRCVPCVGADVAALCVCFAAACGAGCPARMAQPRGCCKNDVRSPAAWGGSNARCWGTQEDEWVARSNAQGRYTRPLVVVGGIRIAAAHLRQGHAIVLPAGTWHPLRERRMHIHLCTSTCAWLAGVCGAACPGAAALAGQAGGAHTSQAHLLWARWGEGGWLRSGRAPSSRGLAHSVSPTPHLHCSALS